MLACTIATSRSQATWYAISLSCGSEGYRVVSFGIVSASSQKGRRPGGRNDAKRTTARTGRRERSELDFALLASARDRPETWHTLAPSPSPPPSPPPPPSP